MDFMGRFLCAVARAFVRLQEIDRGRRIHLPTPQVFSTTERQILSTLNGRGLRQRSRCREWNAAEAIPGGRGGQPPRQRLHAAKFRGWSVHIDQVLLPLVVSQLQRIARIHCVTAKKPQLQSSACVGFPPDWEGRNHFFEFSCQVFEVSCGQMQRSEVCAAVGIGCQDFCSVNYKQRGFNVPRRCKHHFYK